MARLFFSISNFFINKNSQGRKLSAKKSTYSRYFSFTFDGISRENTGSKKLEIGNKFNTMYSSFPQACFSAVAARENAKIEDSHSAVVQVFSMSRFQIFEVIEVKIGQCQKVGIWVWKCFFLNKNLYLSKTLQNPGATFLRFWSDDSWFQPISSQCLIKKMTNDI